LNDVTILHNPRCSKSRATLALLTERGIQPRIVDYLGNPPSCEELEGILALLGIAAHELVRKDEAEYRELGLDAKGLGERELIAVMQAHPRLIQRPIVLANNKAALGRPPEAVLDIL
jgi:arsenate reductase (glutaredoxin)